MSETAFNNTSNHLERQLGPEEWSFVYKVVEGLGINTDPSARANQVAQMGGQGILDLAKKLHEVLAPNVKHETFADPMYIEGPTGSNRRQLAKPAERMGIFAQAATLVGELAVQRQPFEDELFLKRAGNVTALAVVLAHNFEDANGSTARTMAHLIREGYDGSPDIQRDIQTVGSNRPPSGFRINSFLPTKDGLELSSTELLAAAASLDIPLVDEAEYIDRKNQTFTSPYSD